MSSCLHCDKKATKRGMCNTHYGRVQRGTRVDRPVIPHGQSRVDWSNESLVRNCSVTGAHARIKRQWGAASQYPCVECAEPAKDWAYDGTDRGQLLGGHGNRNPNWYSVYPEFYMPLCRSCHKSRDAEALARELAEYRAWKQLTGRTLANCISFGSIR